MDGGQHASDLQLSEEQVQKLIRGGQKTPKLMFPVWSRHVAGSEAGALYEATKRAIDLFFVISAIVIFAPVMLLIAVAIKLDSAGPLFFAHQRTGRNGKRFNVLKFRTMVVDADARKAELAHLNELEWPDFKITNDPRVTRVGRILRRTSLDELPQLFNILRGEMSLVGPRPCSITVEKYEYWQYRRLDVIPGMTGPAQLWRRHSDFAQKCEMDIAYIEHRSLLLDLYLIFQTARMVLLAPTGK
jgi:lipopolysaccharide/colanic/teichoic acid biosynthesis glycosyltransferase